jgi:hypothetical protein
MLPIDTTWLSKMRATKCAVGPLVPGKASIAAISIACSSSHFSMDR